ncbi:MAG: hypothetical protein J5533_05900 [Bacteroidales bacterium]|nr:hypothetical protein [Bacteroidales bacterium]
MRLLTKLKRKLSIGRHRSKVPTGFLPLKEIHSVVVFVDGADEGLEPTKVRILKFFGDNGIKVRFISALDEDLRTSSDLFIALNGHKSVDEHYAAAASTARFKIGRHQLGRQLYDCVVADPTEEPVFVAAAFDYMTKLITQIK